MASINKIKKGEEYPESIRVGMAKIEQDFEKSVQAKLDKINQRVLQYLSTKFRVEKSVKIDLNDMIPDSYYDMNLEELIPAMNIAFDFQRDWIRSKGVDPADVEIDWSAEPLYTEYIGKRSEFLRTVLEETTHEKVAGVIQAGILKGASYDEISTAMEKALGMEKVRATNIARTETNSAFNEASRMYMRDIGISKMKISFAVDACSICKEAALKEYTTDEESPLPLHNQDRCCLYSVIPDEWLQKSLHKSELALIEKNKQEVQEKNDLLQTQIEEVKANTIDRIKSSETSFNNIEKKISSIPELIKTETDQVEKKLLKKSKQLKTQIDSIDFTPQITEARNDLETFLSKSLKALELEKNETNKFVTSEIESLHKSVALKNETVQIEKTIEKTIEKLPDNFDEKVKDIVAPGNSAGSTATGGLYV